MSGPDPFRSECNSLPDQFLTPAPSVEPLPGAGRVIFAGMGGSGLGAGFASAWMSDRRETHVLNDVVLPRWVTSADRVVCVSASGATRETLAVWAEAGRRGCDRAAVCSGDGPLAGLAAEAKAPWVDVPSGLSPRSSLGVLIRGCLAVVGEDGPDVGAVATHLQSVRELALNPSDDGPSAWAAELAPVLPVIAGGDTLTRLAARRWVADFTENAERPALLWEFPEAAHNQIMILAREAPRSLAVSVLALGAPRDPAAAHLWTQTLALLRSTGVPVRSIRQPHPDPWIEALGVAYLGDWVSVFLAEAAGTPAASISLLLELKERLSRNPE